MTCLIERGERLKRKGWSLHARRREAAQATTPAEIGALIVWTRATFGGIVLGRSTPSIRNNPERLRS